MIAAGRIIRFLAHSLALVGGAVLVGLALMTVASVLGRSLGGSSHSAWLQSWLPGLATAIDDIGIGPVTGDFEILEAGIAFCIFAFLPVCQLHDAHARVDVFSRNLPVVVNHGLLAFWEVALAATLVLISWQLFAGLQGKWENAETTFMLQFPVWWGYAASFAGSLVAAVVSLYCAAVRVARLFTGQGEEPPLGTVSPGESH